MDDLTRKYVERINQGLAPQRTPDEPELSSRQYKEFRAQYLPKHLSWYERACNWSARTMTIEPDAKDRPALEEAIRTCHLETTAAGVTSFSLLAPLVFIVAVMCATFILPIGIAAVMGAAEPFAHGNMFLLIFGIIVGVIAIFPLKKLPLYLSNSWRMKASNQMVLCVFYIVTYMRHTSNLELALDFAGDHLAPPLSLDMKKVIWDIETEKYSSVKESLDTYLETWKDHSPEFIESLHLIEGSLLEGSESRRVEMLDKSLTVMLDETYEKMLHYAHNLKSPLTTLHMLGIILPILGLVILPLMVSFIAEVQWYHMAVVYNITLPLLVFLLAKQILSTRPTGYGNDDITLLNPALAKERKVRIPLGGKDALSLTGGMVGTCLMIGLLVVGFYPILHHILNPETDYVIGTEFAGSVRVDSEQYKDAKFFFLNYRLITPKEGDPFILGPFGIGAILMSLAIPLGLGAGIGLIYSLKSRDVIRIREETKKLELEFASALFQLGNRLADGLPAEIAFSKVADVLQGTRTGTFFDIVTNNIAKLGMGVEQAIFDPEHGALLAYPSNIIESSMKVLVESSKKGPLIASRAVINVSEYIKSMHRVDERLRDLMSDTISSMKSQISFLTPVIAGIVIGITSMITSILGSIGQRLADLSSSTDGLGAQGGAGALLEIFGQGGIPTFHFQAIVGIYVVQITYILTLMVNGIENGSDALAENDLLGKNLWRATLLYVIISATTIVLFGFIAGAIADV